MNKLLTWLRTFRKSHTPLVEVHINARQLRENYRILNTSAKVPVAPVLKSNAYGHGLTLVAEILKSEKPPFFVVDSYYEAQHLRNAGIKTPILIIGYTLTRNIQENRLKDIAFTIVSLKSLRELSNKLTKPTSIHLKINTGMNRHGIAPHEIGKALEIIESNKHITLQGVCTHFADAEEDTTFTHKQITIWKSCLNLINNKYPSIPYIHSQNSAGIAGNFGDEATVARSGLALYGYSSIPGITPVLTLKTIIDCIQTIEPGETVGYARTFLAQKPMKIATIPVGYYEGVDRRLSNKGSVIIHGIACPIIGRVSMNITTIDVSHLETVMIGDTVEVFSPTTTAELAQEAGTIIYDILVHIPATLRRIVKKSDPIQRRRHCGLDR